MIFFFCFYFYPYQLRSFRLIYLPLGRKRFVKSKEIWKPGTNPLLSVVKVVLARSVQGSRREGRWNLSPSSFFHLLSNRMGSKRTHTSLLIEKRRESFPGGMVYLSNIIHIMGYGWVTVCSGALDAVVPAYCLHVNM